jgi:uncharacterized membrane protein YfcA
MKPFSTSTSTSTEELGNRPMLTKRIENHRLMTLALPWALIVVIAIGAAFWNQDVDESSEEWSMGDSVERLLESEHHVHKPVYEETHPHLFPLTNSDKLGFVFAVIGLMIAAGGGIGGGGILVPIYILVMGFSPKHAIPLSNITVFGGACANMWLNTQKRHPLADRPLVDWDLILVMEPLTIAGALMGAFLNKVLPETLLVIMLVVLLSFTAYNTLKKAIKMYKAETIRFREQGINPDGTKESELSRIEKVSKVGTRKEAGDELLENMDLQEGEVPGDGGTEEVKIHDELNEILEQEKVVPMTNVYILVCLFIVVLSVNVLKGGGAFPSPIGIKCGSMLFWAANAAMLVWIIIVAGYARSYLVNRFETKKRVGYQYVEGDIKWDSRSTVVYPCICCFAGFFAGMFGVGKFDTLFGSIGMRLRQLNLTREPSNRWWHCQGTFNACNGSPPSCCIWVVSVHDSFH